MGQYVIITKQNPIKELKVAAGEGEGERERAGNSCSLSVF